MGSVSAAAWSIPTHQGDLDHPDYIFKPALQDLAFSSLPAMPRAFWKVQPGDPFLSLTACTYLAVSLCIVSVLRNVMA